MMIRYGALAHEMRSMTDEDLFSLRLKLLIVMAKGYLNGYPLGVQREAAVRENARIVFYQALHRTHRWEAGPDESVRSDDRYTHLFYQRIQLLAVMVQSFATGHRLEDYRRRALEENLRHVCGALSGQIERCDMQFLKVA